MALTLDHVILAVDDLDAASATMRAEGFTVTPGGVHGNGVTQNNLIVFEDGTYIELLAPTGTVTTADAGYAPLLAKGEGWSGFALHSDNLRKDLQALRGRGVPVADSTPGSRSLPTGETIRWQTAMIPETCSPFYIQDETPRALRVPDTKPVVTHRNGVSGAIGLVIVVPALEEAIARYRSLLGMLPRLDESEAVFDLRGTALRLTEPGDDADMRQHLEERGDAPYQLILRSRDLRPMGSPARKVLGARIDIAPRLAS